MPSSDDLRTLTDDELVKAYRAAMPEGRPRPLFFRGQGKIPGSAAQSRVEADVIAVEMERRGLVF